MVSQLGTKKTHQYCTLVPDAHRLSWYDGQAERKTIPFQAMHSLHSYLAACICPFAKTQRAAEPVRQQALLQRQPLEPCSSHHRQRSHRAGGHPVPWRPALPPQTAPPHTPATVHGRSALMPSQSQKQGLKAGPSHFQCSFPKCGLGTKPLERRPELLQSRSGQRHCFACGTHHGCKIATIAMLQLSLRKQQFAYMSLDSP